MVGLEQEQTIGLLRVNAERDDHGRRTAIVGDVHGYMTLKGLSTGLNSSSDARFRRIAEGDSDLRNGNIVWLCAMRGARRRCWIEAL